MQSLMGIRDYLLDMVDKFDADPSLVNLFFEEEQIPVPVQGELRGIFELILLLKEIGTSFHDIPNAEDLFLNFNVN